MGNGYIMTRHGPGELVEFQSSTHDSLLLSVECARRVNIGMQQSFLRPIRSQKRPRHAQGFTKERKENRNTRGGNKRENQDTTNTNETHSSRFQMADRLTSGSGPPLRRGSTLLFSPCVSYLVFFTAEVVCCDHGKSTASKHKFRNDKHSRPGKFIVLLTT